MKVTIGAKVSSDFGDGPVVAMSKEWCIILTNPNCPEGHREVAVTWDQVSILAEPGETLSSIESKDIL